MPLCPIHPLNKVEELVRCNVCNFVICRAVSGTTNQFPVIFGKVGAIQHGSGIDRTAKDRYSDHKACSVN